MLSRMVRPDAKGRITLGRLAHGVSGYIITETPDHKLILDPRVEIPAREKWLFNNKEALQDLRLGLEDAEKGRLVNKGSFANYIDDDID